MSGKVALATPDRRLRRNVIFILGPNGAGKTTTIRHLMGFLKPDVYSRAVTPQVRQAGNRLSGLTETAYASLLA